MAWTAPSTWSAGATVTAAQLNQQLRDNLKAIGDPWTSWAPTYAGLTIGNATVTAKYIQPGKLVIGEVKIVFGSTSTFSGTFTVSLPVTAALTANQAAGPSVMNDTSASAFRTGTAAISGTNFVVFCGDGSPGAASNSVPFTWANGDTLTFQFTYEAA